MIALLYNEWNRPEGESCPCLGCNGVLVESTERESCTCFLGNAPCTSCETNWAECPECGYEAREHGHHHWNYAFHGWDIWYEYDHDTGLPMFLIAGNPESKLWIGPTKYDNVWRYRITGKVNEVNAVLHVVDAVKAALDRFAQCHLWDIELPNKEMRLARIILWEYNLAELQRRPEEQRKTINTCLKQASSVGETLAEQVTHRVINALLQYQATNHVPVPAEVQAQEELDTKDYPTVRNSEAAQRRMLEALVAKAPELITPEIAQMLKQLDIKQIQEANRQNRKARENAIQPIKGSEWMSAKGPLHGKKLRLD